MRNDLLNALVFDERAINGKSGILLDQSMLVWECVVSSISFIIIAKHKFELRKTYSLNFKECLRKFMLFITNDIGPLVKITGYRKRVFDASF